MVEFEHKKLIEIAGEGETVARVAILHPVIRARSGTALRSPERKLEEACGLAEAIQLEVGYTSIVNVRGANPGLYFGTGKVKELKGLFEELELDLVVVDGTLSPIQQRNLEKAWDVKILDRTGLILEIFSARARTREGRMQVELAHLNYQKSRLVRSWTHLERQRGGLGFVGGPGETQIEADRRMINDRVTKLKRQLEKVTQTRKVHRSSRKKIPYPIVALVGYTNAGKSTLFNKLTNSSVFAKDLLFATLDPTMRLVDLPGGRKAVLSDTVGFISDLPTDLIASFRATLEEVLEADIVLHVRDEASPDSEAERLDVITVLEQLGISPDAAHIVEVLNKSDLIEKEDLEILQNRVERDPKQVLTSAVTGEGCDDLLAVIEDNLSTDDLEVTYSIAHTDGEAMAWLYRHGDVEAREDGEESARITLVLSPANIGKFTKAFSIFPLDETGP